MRVQSPAGEDAPVALSVGIIKMDPWDVNILFCGEESAQTVKTDEWFHRLTPAVIGNALVMI